MVDIYHKEQSLILSVMTRWGTQYHLCNSVLKNKDALTAWAIHKDTEIGKKGNGDGVKDVIMDDQFWVQLEKLCKVLKVIHEAQKKSESNDSTLGKVIPRWLQL
jgi:uncharacterized protein (UPF0548 family)